MILVESSNVISTVCDQNESFCLQITAGKYRTVVNLCIMIITCRVK